MRAGIGGQRGYAIDAAVRSSNVGARLPDHYSLAFTYDCIAATRDVSLDLSSYGWITTPLQRDNILVTEWWPRSGAS